MSLGFAAQIVDEVAGGEAGGTALADVGDLAPGEQVLARRRRQYLRAVAEVRKHALHDALRAPVQVSKEDRDFVAFLAREGLRLVGAIGFRALRAGGGTLRAFVGSASLATTTGISASAFT